MPERLITLLPADMTPAIYPLGEYSSEGECPALGPEFYPTGRR
ncbi:MULTISPECIES: hypothetical protein [Photorhabdus]|nr:hypothetical protein [Photorhabdus akhurstii]